MKIDNESLATLSALEYVPGKLGHVKIVETLDRGAYTKLDKVLQALGGKWNRSAKAHIFDGDAQARIDHAITTGEVETGQDVGHFPTPGALALDLCERADLKRGMDVLEPSAGNGDIVIALAMDAVQITAIERDPTRRSSLRNLAHTIGKSKMTVLDLDDCMLLTPEHAGLFDRVVMNPPFCRVGRGDHLDHVRHAFGMLLSGGRLISVLPSSVSFRRDRRHADFRAWVIEHGVMDPLPERSFKESGTNVSTVVARMVKP